MRLRPGPVAAVVLLIGLGVWVYLSEFRGAPERQKAEQTKDRVFPFDRADLRAIVLKNAGGTVRLQKEGDAWAITEPIAAPADKDAVEGMLTSLETARVERRLGAEGDRKTFGLDPPPMSVMLETAAGPPQSVALGDTNPIGGAYFAALPSGDLAVVSVSLGEVAKRDLFAVRDKSLLAFDPWKTKSLVIERGAELIAIEKKDAGWTITRPIEAPADGPTVTELLSGLERLRASSFVAERATPEELKAWGFDPPAVRMAILQEGWDASKTVEFGAEKDGERRARTIGRDAVVAVGPDFWPRATTALFDLRRRDALGLSQYRLRSISIAVDGGRALVLEKGTEGNWKVSGLGSGTVPYDSVDTLVRTIADIKAAAFDDDPAPSLVESIAARPVIDATLEQEPDAEGGAAARQHLLIGPPGRYGRVPVKDQAWRSILWGDGAVLAKVREQVKAIVATAAEPPPAPPAEAVPSPGSGGESGGDAAAPPADSGGGSR